MKKIMIISFSLVSMAFASLVFIQPAHAYCELVARDSFGCDLWDCYDIGCIYWHCVNTPGNGEYCYN